MTARTKITLVAGTLLLLCLSGLFIFTHRQSKRDPMVPPTVALAPSGAARQGDRYEAAPVASRIEVVRSSSISSSQQLEMLASRPAGPDRAIALMQLAAAWASNSCVDAAAAMLQLSDPDDRDRALGQVIAYWATIDPEAAVDWLRGAATDTTPLTLQLTMAFAAWARTDPAGASSKAVAVGASSECVSAALSAWMRRNPPEAHQFLQQHVSGAMRGQVASSLLIAAAAVDSGVARALVDEWIGNWAPEIQFSLAKSIMQTDPATAIYMADRMSEPAGRDFIRAEVAAGNEVSRRGAPDGSTAVMRAGDSAIRRQAPQVEPLGASGFKR